MAAPESVQVPLADEQVFSVEDWETATAGVLRKMRRLDENAPDADVWSVLAHETLDGLRVTPLGTPSQSAELTRPPLPAPHELEGWDVRAHFTDPDAEVTARDVVTDLENGVNSLWLVVGAAGVRLDDLESILQPVFLDLAPVVLQAEDQLAAARELVRIADARGVSLHPRSNLGVSSLDRAQVAEAAELARAAGVRAFIVDASAVHDDGASDVQELAWALSAGVDLLRAVGADGAGLIEFRFAATDEQFETIAKFRAARRLWSRVLELSDVEAPAPQAQHAVTSRSMMTKYDTYVNMLRGTIAAFAAGVGGAESVTVLPFDEPIGLPEPFSRRIARNTSSLLIAESHIAKVADPAGGSHLVETLTDELARAAWTLFGELETQPELLATTIADAVDQRARQVARRKRPITGVSEFPNLGEELPRRKPYVETPAVHRYAAAFESLRDDPASAPVFLATMGTVAEHTARATFASNLLAAGGIGTAVAGPTRNAEEVVAAYVGAGSPSVVMLAGPDGQYGAWGSAVVDALRAAGAEYVIVAGKPDGLGVDDSAAVGVDALAFLHRVRLVLSPVEGQAP